MTRSEHRELIGVDAGSALHAEPQGGEIWYSKLELRDPAAQIANQGRIVMIRSVGVLVMVLSFAAIPARGQAEPDFEAACHEQIEAALDALASTGDFDRAMATLSSVFDLVVAHADDRKPDPFIEAAAAVRLIDQLSTVGKADQLKLLAYLREHDDLGRTMAMLIRESEDPAAVYAVLQRLRVAHGDKVAEYPLLTAAICVVRDRPLSFRVNENNPVADTPEAIFDYFVRNESRLSYPIKTVPAKLLMYVVDSTAKVDEMEWALSQYQRDKKIGNRFFEIHYDTSHLKRGTPKRVTKEGFSLPNIKAFGGVCADQAYFAVSVAKAQGIPSAYTKARSGEGGHAWVGFLDSQGRRAWWDFSEGRYEDYENLRGDVINPQTGQTVSDASVSMLSQLIGVNQKDRHAAIAMADAAERLARYRRGEEGEEAEGGETLGAYPPDVGELPARGRLKRPRLATVDEELDLLEAGLRRCSGDQRSWLVVASMSRDGEMTFKQKKYWAGALMRMCGSNYPDFTVLILRPMIVSIEDTQEQNRMWNNMFKLCKARPDLAAEVRLEQGDMWQRDGNMDFAWKCYEDTAQRYLNDGPFAVVAMDRCEKMLRESGRSNYILPLYEEAWKRVERPSSSLMFSRWSNWYMVGRRYAKALYEAGRESEAKQVVESMGG